MSILDQMNAIPYYWDDCDFPEDRDIPHCHRCVDCGGWIIQPGIDNTTCIWCVDGGRPRCHHCEEKGA